MCFTSDNAEGSSPIARLLNTINATNNSVEVLYFIVVEFRGLIGGRQLSLIERGRLNSPVLQRHSPIQLIASRSQQAKIGLVDFP